MVYSALLPLMRTPRLPVVDWTDAPADVNGLVRFAERRNLVSARVPSHFKRSLILLDFSHDRSNWFYSSFSSTTFKNIPARLQQRFPSATIIYLCNRIYGAERAYSPISAAEKQEEKKMQFCLLTATKNKNMGFEDMCYRHSSYKINPSNTFHEPVT